MWKGVYYALIVCITINSVMKMEKKNYPEIYLWEWKYKIKKIKKPKFINTEQESELASDSE